MEPTGFSAVVTKNQMPGNLLIRETARTVAVYFLIKSSPKSHFSYVEMMKFFGDPNERQIIKSVERLKKLGLVK